MPAFQPNDLILKGTYRIEKQIGQGAFGEVYLATYLKLGVQRAIKVVRRGEGVGSTNYEQYRDRFVLEAKLGATFHNTNVIHVNHFEEEEGRLFLIMDYAPGGSLAVKIEESKGSGKPIPIETAVKWVSEAAEGLSKLHDKDMVHRDIKPSNILIDTEGHACIADLGLVQLPTSRVEGGSLGINHPGTAEYMPLEQLTGNYMPLRASADVYALGCVLFELLTGRQYYHREEGTLSSSLRSEVPTWLDQVISKALSVKARERYSDASELLKTLEGKIDNPVGSVVEKQKKVEEPIHTQTSTINKQAYKHGDDRRDNDRKPKSWIKPILGISGLVVMVVLGVISAANGWLKPSTQIIPTVTNDPIHETPIITILSTNTIMLKSTETPVLPTPTMKEIPLGIGSTQVSPIDGMIMVYVPAGDIILGSDEVSNNPQRIVHLDSFWIDNTEVTIQMYEKCVSEGACSAPKQPNEYYYTQYYGNPDFEDSPAVYINWSQAFDYCHWVGGALPTEAQWEKAAITFFSENENGIIFGNREEWVYDIYGELSNELEINPIGPIKGSNHVIRGGNYISTATIKRRSYTYPSNFNSYISFRCVNNTEDSFNDLIYTQITQTIKNGNGLMVQNAFFDQNLNNNSQNSNICFVIFNDSDIDSDPFILRIDSRFTPGLLDNKYITKKFDTLKANTGLTTCITATNLVATGSCASQWAWIGGEIDLFIGKDIFDASHPDNTANYDVRNPNCN